MFCPACHVEYPADWKVCPKDTTNLLPSSRTPARLLLLTAATALGACTPYDPALGPTPFLCGTTEPKCPDGYTCVSTGGKSVCTTTAVPGDGPPSSGNCTMPFSGVLATWSLAGETGSQTSTNAASSAPGVTAAPITRAPALIAAAGSGSINSTNWPLGSALDPMSYYTVSLTPPAGCALVLSAASIDVKSSGTGPAMAAVGTSSDGFAQTQALATTAPSTPTLSASASGNLELRIFGYGATAVSGTMRIQNDFTVSGKLQ